MDHGKWPVGHIRATGDQNKVYHAHLRKQGEGRIVIGTEGEGGIGYKEEDEG